ncbi:glucose 1-dehydrogenase [Fulvivirga ligni]|uniref:glucose 1-dehydrogenase n=1 Tax=Fulvivirga ligni TaxID=2904246 RepID=UPI001F193BCD|nr:glucose 1-dehydrogenase [Fulvivirga ligni]UII20927.1 glucose 1-dehydrogenase [Fulvivirga ligni]
MKRLEGKVALITGGNSGIGLATAKLFVQEGAKVVITGRRQEALNEAIKEIGGDAVAVLADAKDIPANKEAVIKTVEAFGNIDILFLNAGVAKFSPILDITENHFDEHFNINVKGPFFTIKEALPYMNEGGAIISTTSVVGQKGFSGSGVYSATKAALRSLSRVLANELAEKKIRTVSVAPGPIETPIFSKMDIPADQVDEMGKGFAQQVPLGRMGKSEEIAKTVLFLASDDASFINGVEFEVDGGLSQV